MNERKKYHDGKKIHGEELNEFSCQGQCKGNLLQKTLFAALHFCEPHGF
jgi:hypothetical protein